MLAHFPRVADAVGLPVMLYTFPELTGKRIDPGVPKGIMSPEARAIYSRLVVELRAFGERCGLALAATARS